jgi:hypothetical protein
LFQRLFFGGSQPSGAGDIRRRPKFAWSLLLASTFGAAIFSGLLVLFGDFFNPWFTAFSYLKGAILTLIAVVVAGTGVLVIEQFFPFTSKTRATFRRPILILIIVVDALRGDAFYSAGYRRNLTPFLDRWALEEGLSFRRAYSQGGGSFAA